MVDPGSSATNMSFELFKKVGKAAGIPKSSLQIPKVILHDYSQRPIPISAESLIGRVTKQITAPVYICSDIGLQGEPFLLGTNVVIPLGLMVPGNGVILHEDTKNLK